MNYEIKDYGILLNNREHFSARAILECGQVFRFKEIPGGYEVISIDKRCQILEGADETRLITNDPEYFIRYFDLDRDYGAIIDMLNEIPDMREATEFGKGMRILNQDLFETLISFIISANNNIKRIQGIIARLCAALGESKGDYYAFPTPEAMATAGRELYYTLGAGYRADYLYDTACLVASGAFDLNKIWDMPTSEAAKYLITLPGVGSKVADCILLFAYHRMDVFPVDTWIAKVYADQCEVCATRPMMREFLINKYGKELSGYAQQYLFYYKRFMSRAKN
jgi:N-glycosylase/DNA lyase